MAGRKWRGRASGKQCQEYIPQVSAWVPALTICSALGLATLPLAVTNPGWTVSPLALSTNAIGGALCSTCWWPHSIRANSTSAGILLWLVPMAARANAGLGASADPDERVLYQSRADDFRRGVCRPALRLPGGGDPLWLADRRADDGRPRPGGIDPRTVDHDGDLCRVCRRLHQSGIGR
ncbi:hypothetical protein BANRA_05289 [Klebsiella pneumoniae]|nr:hypothetical protein BANRA_05289 [Klebsiella pneumoniae]